MTNFENISNEKAKKVVGEVVIHMNELFDRRLINVILYGSYARNENTLDSDIDVLILVDLDEEKIRKYEDKLTDIMVDLSLKYDVVLSLYAYSAAKYKEQVNILPFLYNIEKEGIAVYG